MLPDETSQDRCLVFPNFCLGMQNGDRYDEFGDASPQWRSNYRGFPFQLRSRESLTSRLIIIPLMPTNMGPILRSFPLLLISLLLRMQTSLPHLMFPLIRLMHYINLMLLDYSEELDGHLHHPGELEHALSLEWTAAKLHLTGLNPDLPDSD